jgi:hypothetical protein
MVLSPARLERIENHLDANHINLLRSPPYSGKTALGQTLRDHFLGLNHEALYITMAGIIGGKALHDNDSFDEYWKKRVGYTWHQILSCTERTYVFIDEAQILYGDRVPFFWGPLKEILSDSAKSDALRVLLLAAYDPTFNEPTPIQFQNSLGLDTLRLSLDEFHKLTASYVELHRSFGSPSFTVPALVETALFNLTAGHVGICRTALAALRHRFRFGGTVVDMLQHLVSPAFRTSLESTRSFIWTQTWQPTNEESQFLREVFLSCDSESSFDDNLDLNESTRRKFLKSGLLASSGRGLQLQFAAPIMRTILGRLLFATTRVSNPSNPTTFNEFMTRTIERMSPSALAKSLGRGVNSRLLERSWQMAWYKAATSTSPYGSTISPDVGSVFGSVGFLDFYVNGSYCWGVELLREGSQIKEHAKRFVRGGQYEEIPLQEWAIVDFRHHSKAVRELRSNFWYVLYSEDYKEAIIKRLDHDDQTIVLRGDEGFL